MIDGVPSWLVAMLIFIYGLLIGSFLNAWIWRIHTARKISRGRSMCPHCKTTLHWYELVPLVSYIGLRGKCRTCHKPISKQYPLVELATAVLWLALYLVIQPTAPYGWMTLLVWLAIGSLLIGAFVYDAKWMLLPEVFTVSALVIALAWLGVRWIGFQEGELVLHQLIGAAVLGASFWALSYFSGGKLMGDGDSRLGLLMGLLLTPAQLVLAVVVSFNLGALVGVGLILTGRKTRKDAIAFGPFLISGLILSFLVGQWLITKYFMLFSV